MSETRRIYCDVSWLEMFREAIRAYRDNPDLRPAECPYVLGWDQSFAAAERILTEAIEAELPEVRTLDVMEAVVAIRSRLNEGVCNVSCRDY